MDRRAFIAVVGGSMLAAPLAAGAQQPGQVPRVGYISPGSSSDPFRQRRFLDVALFRQASPKDIEMCASRARATDLEPADTINLASLLRGALKRQKKGKSKYDREPDPSHGHLGGGWLAGV